MADFLLDIHQFFNSEKWTRDWAQALAQVALCKEQCTSSECSVACQRPLDDLTKFIERKKEMYVKKGVEYCKKECWETRDIRQCAERCVQEYSTLFTDFQQTLFDRLHATKFHDAHT